MRILSSRYVRAPMSFATLACLTFGISTSVRGQVRNSGSQTQLQISRVPFVGCKSDGQTGPLPAPNAPDKPIQVAASAPDLAFYKAQYGVGVLGPRGWDCYGVYGSSGSTLVIVPKQTNADMPTNSITGPAIQVTESSGDTSGRFQVAKISARVFPAEKGFVDRILREGFLPAADFPSGSYPADRLVYRDARVVEYETPARSEGLGTQSRLKQNGNPIRGVVILIGENPDLLQLSMRLPSNNAAAASFIIQQFEQENK